MSPDAREQFRIKIGDTLGLRPDQVTLFAKGRVALYAILRALDVGPGDEVILPAFTCVAVPNAILYSGARPVYVDIDAATYTLDPFAAAAAVTPNTRVILAQNTFGLSSDLDALAAIGEKRGLTIIDDCTHGLGGTYRGRPNGATAQLSFFSTQWSKSISTGLGGFAVAREEAAAPRLRAIEATAAEPSPVQVALLRALLMARDRAGHGSLLRFGRGKYRALGRLGMVPGSSSRAELEGTAMPSGFLTRLSEVQARLGCDRIGRLAVEVERRRLIARQYSDWLRAEGRTVAAEPETSKHAFLRYPLRVSDRREFAAAAARSGVDAGDWFISPIHPVLEGLDRWGYAKGTAPVAELACQEIVNLPTDPTMRPSEVDRVLSLMAKAAHVIR